MATESNDVVRQLQAAGLPVERYAAAIAAVVWMPSAVKQAIASARTPEETRAILDRHLANKPGKYTDVQVCCISEQWDMKLWRHKAMETAWTVGCGLTLF